MGELRRKQVQAVQFYRQKPIGNYIVDFYAPMARIVVEVDASQIPPNPPLRKGGERIVASSVRDAGTHHDPSVRISGERTYAAT